MVKPRIVWIVILALVAIGGVSAFLRTPAEDVAPTFITDAHGRAVIAHAFNTASSAKYTDDGLPEFTEEDLDRENADMGTNFVRFLISWRAIEPNPNEYDYEYLDAVAERVAWYEARGYVVMLDMHQDLWGVVVERGGDPIGNGAPAWATEMDGLRVSEQEMWELYYLEPGVIRAFDHFWNTTGKHPELAEHYVKTWQIVAKYFADNDAVVAYDLMNEPYGGTIQGPAFEAGPLTNLYQRATNAIREVDQNTWVCVEPQAVGYNWGTPSGLGKINDPRDGEQRIAYCPHLYPLPMDLGSGYEGNTKSMVDATIDAWRGNTLRTAERLGGVPIILGEFGLDTNKPGAINYVKKVYAVADSIGAGVAYWSRDNGSWGPYEEDGTARNLVAALDRLYPRAIAGTPHSWTLDGDNLELTLTPHPDITAPTEFQLPTTGFANGAEVTGATITNYDPETRILQVEVRGTTKTTVTVSPK